MSDDSTKDKVDAIKDDQPQSNDSTTASHHITQEADLGKGDSENDKTTKPAADTKTPETVRQNMISLATSFLNSPNVRSSTRERQVAFLKNKGLTDEEIDVAYKAMTPVTAAPQSSTVSSNNVPSSSSASSPPLPLKTFQQQQQPLQPHPQSLKDTDDIVKKIRYAVLIAGGLTAAVILVIRVFITPLLDRLFQARSDLHSHQLSLVKQLQERLNTFKLVSLKPEPIVSEAATDEMTATSSNPEPTPETVELQKTPSPSPSTSPSTFMTPLHHSLSKLRDLSKQAKITPSTDGIRDSLTDLSTYLTTESYFRPSYGYGVSDYTYYINPDKEKEKKEPDLAEGCRNEIRSLKGMLLARRTFPNPVR